MKKSTGIKIFTYGLWMSRRRLAALYLRRLGMKKVLKLVCLLGLIAVVAVTTFAYTVPSQAPPPEALRPIVSACAMLVVGGAAGSGSAAFIKRHTAATGV
jgi:peptidoglycan/LPS O-acetylase OafA/YrhL